MVKKGSLSIEKVNIGEIMNSLLQFLRAIRLAKPQRVAMSRVDAARLVSEPEGESLESDEVVEHLMRGYDNTQQVVQFMDAKAGVVIAMAIGVLALLSGIVSWLYDRSGEEQLLECIVRHPIGLWSTLILGFCSALAGVVSLKFAFKTVRPNGLPKEEHFGILFPVVEKPWENEFAVGYLDEFIRSGTRGALLQDIKRQMLAMGGIVHTKIGRLKSAIGWLLWQTCFLVGFMAMVVAMIVNGCLPTKTDETPKPLKVWLLNPEQRDAQL